MKNSKRTKKEVLLSKLQGKELEKIILCTEPKDEGDVMNEWIVLLNVSYDSGVDGFSLVAVLKELRIYHLVASIEMYDGQKPYTYLEAISKKAALQIYNTLNDLFIPRLNRNLFLGLAVEVPLESFLHRPVSDPKLVEQLVPGSMLFLDFIQSEEEEAILAEMEDLTTRSPWETLNKRSVQHFGYRFDYPSNLAEKEALQDNPLPQTTHVHLTRAQNLIVNKDSSSYTFPQVFDAKHSYFNQLTVNKYEPGDGIAPHTDSLVSFGTPILIISLLSAILMEFTPPSADSDQSATGVAVQVVLPPRSLLVLGGKARIEWTHGIRNRKVDVVDGLVIERATRISLTFRHVYPELGCM